MEQKDVKAVLNVKDQFAKKRHKEKLEIVNLRYKIALDLLKKRDDFHGKRHKERLDLLEARM